MTTIYTTLESLLADSPLSDVHEEDATEFLDEHRIAYSSHSRQFLYSLAWKHGWRPPGGA